MPKKSGLTEAVFSVLCDGDWYTCSQVVANVPAPLRLRVAKVLSQNAAAGVLERRGERRAYEYRLRGGLPAAKSEPRPQPAAPHLAAAVGSLTPALGRQAEGPAVPRNRSEGDIADALRGVLCDEPLTLAEILDALPIGWSRTDAISGLSEGVTAGWVHAADSDGRWRYALIEGKAPPEAPPPHPYTVTPLRTRLNDFRLQSRQLLADASTDDVPPDVLVALASAHKSIDSAWQALH